jgi:hypothetical protein
LPQGPQEALREAVPALPSRRSELPAAGDVIEITPEPARLAAPFQSRPLNPTDISDFPEPSKVP